MPEWAYASLLKMIGAMAGSGIAAWLRRSARFMFHLVAGAWFGYVSGQWLLDYMSWPMTADYILLSGSIMGAASCSILEAAFYLFPEIRNVLRAWLVRKAETGADR
jgi:hypothetical protein